MTGKRATALLLFPAASVLFAQVEAAGQTTPTQAIVRYTAPDSSPCRMEVSESPGYAPLVHDVDPVLFPGADMDAREGNVTAGLDRWFVVGKRTVEKGADGKRYSRALQAATNHYYRLTCGAQQFQGEFTTMNPPLGNTSPETLPWDPSAMGNYGWPGIDFSDRSQAVVDPLTGLLIRKFTAPGDRGGTALGQKFQAALDLNGVWKNPSNAISADGSAGPAIYTGQGGDPLFLWVDPAAFQVVYRDPGGWNPNYTVDDIRVNTIGGGTDGDPANRTISVCLTLDSGQSCATGALDVILPSSRGAAPAVPSSFPSPMFAGWKNALGKGRFGPPRGKVSVSNGAVTLVGGASGGAGSESFFKSAWSPGTKILIAGTDPVCPGNFCTIASVLDSTHLTLYEDPGSLDTVAYKGADFGLRVVKKTNTGTVSVNFGFDYAASNQFGMPYTGATEICSHVPTTTGVDADGNPLPGGAKLSGYMCAAMTASNETLLYFFIPQTGESRLLTSGQPVPTSSDAAADKRKATGSLVIGPQAFDPVLPNVVYFADAPFSGPRSIYRLTYKGDYRAYKAVYLSRNWPPDNFDLTNITPPSQGLAILSQVQAKVPGYDPAIWGDFSRVNGIGMMGNYYAFGLGAIGARQDAPCRFYLFDVKAQPYATFAGITDSYSSPSLRWGGCHTLTSGIGSYIKLSPKVLGQDGMSSTNTLLGPFKLSFTEVFKGGAWSSDTSLTATYADDCPADLDPKWIALGATGKNCVRLRVQGEPCSFQPNISAGENVNFPCAWNSAYSALQPMQEGDSFGDGINGGGSEHMLIARKQAYNSGFELVVQRFLDCKPTMMAHANGWLGVMTPAHTCRGTEAWLDAANPQNGWMTEDPSMTGTHSDYGAGTTSTKVTAVRASYTVRYDSDFPASIGQPANIAVNGNTPAFAGVSAGAPTQSYPSKRQWNAPVSEQVWVLDLRHLNPSLGLMPESPVVTFGSYSIRLVDGTNQVYKIQSLGAFKPKQVPLFAYAGRYLFKEKSGPAQGDTLTDADSWRFCVALFDGECRQNAKAGDVYISAPFLDLDGRCHTNQYAQNYPCVFTPGPHSGWAVQWDVSRNDPAGVNFRRLTMGFSGPGRQYEYGNLRAIPDGSWALTQGYWLDGLRNDLIAIKLPPWPGSDGNEAARSNFFPVAITVPAQQGYDSARIRFGYAENGAPTQFYCTPRAEACLTGSSPFAYESENPNWSSCGSGCQINVPGYWGRVLYYAIDRKAPDGTVSRGTLQVMPVE